MVEWQFNGRMDSTYVAISAILPLCHSFCRLAIPTITAIRPFRLPYRHSICHSRHYFCCGLRRSYINSWLRSLHACICNFFHSVNNSHIMTNSWIHQYCTILHSITNDIINTDFCAVGPIGLFRNNFFNFWRFCKIISKQIKFSKNISLKWCPIAGFAEAESISTTSWQSAQYVAFSRLSLVYFVLLEDFKDNLDKKKSNHFNRSLFFGSSSFCLSFWKVFLNRTLLMIRFGYFYCLVYAMGYQLKKLLKTIHTNNGKLEAK